MPEESKTPNKPFKQHVVNVGASILCGVALAAVFLVGSHMGIQFSEFERIGLVGGAIALLGGGMYSAKQLPGKVS